MEPVKLSDLKKPQTRLLVVIGVLFLVLLSWTGFIDAYSKDYVDDVLVQASVTFAVARTLNAVISLLQSIDLQLLVVGISPGELLDPFNDMVEQFSTLMQFAVGSLILQKVLLLLVADTIFKIALTVIGALLVISAYTPRMTLINVLLKTFVSMAFLRFSVVLIVLLNGWVDSAFLEDQTRRDVSKLEGLPATIDVMNQEMDAGVPSLEAMHDSGMADLAAKEADLVAGIASVDSQLQNLAKEKAAADASLAEIESQLSATERYNFINRSPEHRDAITQIEAIEKRMSNLEGEREAFLQAVERIEEERLALIDAKDGKTGFWSSLGSGIGSMAGKVAKLGDMDTYKELMTILHNAVGTMLTVMTLFVLKAMILPLLFLYLFVQFFKKIWGLDLRTVKQQLQNELAVTPERLS